MVGDVLQARSSVEHSVPCQQYPHQLHELENLEAHPDAPSDAPRLARPDHLIDELVAHRRAMRLECPTQELRKRRDIDESVQELPLERDRVKHGGDLVARSGPVQCARVLAAGRIRVWRRRGNSAGEAGRGGRRRSRRKREGEKADEDVAQLANKRCDARRKTSRERRWGAGVGREADAGKQLLVAVGRAATPGRNLAGDGRPVLLSKSALALAAVGRVESVQSRRGGNGRMRESKTTTHRSPS